VGAARAQCATSIVTYSDTAARTRPVGAARQDAKSAGDRDDWQTAYNLMLEAWQRRQASDIAVNLAYIEIELGKFRDAAEHLAYGLRNFPADADPELLRLNRERLVHSKQQVVTLAVSAKPANARVSLNDKPLGIASELPPEIFVEPGAINITADLEGHQPKTERLAGAAGQELSAKIVLEPIASDEPATINAPLVTPPPENVHTERSLVPVYIGVGATAVGLGLVAVFALNASSDADEADRLRAALGPMPGACADGTGAPATCRALSDAVDGHDNNVTALEITAGVTAAVGLFTIGYLVWPALTGRSTATTAPWSPSARISDNGAVLGVHHAF